MSSIRLACLVAGLVLIGLGHAAAETADCAARLKRQDDECQRLAETLAGACPSGTNIKETPRCRELSTEIAKRCTRKPCAPPPRRKAKAKAPGKGEPRGKPATSPKTRTGN